MGGSSTKRNSAIPLKAKKAHPRENSEQRTIKANISSYDHASEVSLEYYSQLQDSSRRHLKPEVESSKSKTSCEPVESIDVTAATGKPQKLRKRVEIPSNRRNIIRPKIPLKSRISLIKPLNLSGSFVVEQLMPDDPFDKLNQRRFEQRAFTKESPEVRTSSMKLLTPCQKRSPSSYHTSRGLLSFSEQIKKIKAVQTEKLCGIYDKTHEDLMKNSRGESTPAETSYAVPDVKTSTKTYHMTHKRTMSQKELPSVEGHFKSLNSNKAERQWQWLGAFGPLAKLTRE